MNHSSEAQAQVGHAGYEKRDVNIVWAGIVTAVIVMIIVLSVAFVDEIFVATKEAMVTQYQLAPENNQLRDLRAREAEVLTTYKLLDPQKQIYRIPIDRAMQVLADEAYTSQRSAVTPR
ncbi:MAG: hypothetical protein IT585_06500 [candidate division Zixibacteria bacterium]|nr:hypothetical protein [candidate division Zixibacteria bacterium]